MHPIEFLFYLVIFSILIYILVWLGNIPTRSRYDELIKLLDIENNKLEILKIDYKYRKSQVGFFKKLTVDKTELLSHQEKFRKLTEEHKRHAIKFDTAEYQKDKERKKKAKDREENVIGVVRFGMLSKSIFDAVTKLIR